MGNSTIKPIVGPCLDCNRNTFLTAGRCKIDYAKHRAKVCAGRKAERPTIEPVKTIQIKASRKTTSLLNKSDSELKAIAQKDFNAFIRKKGTLPGGVFICESCQEVKSVDQMNAGHYYSMGNHSYLRYDESNCWPQCIRRNLHLHGNLIPYRENLLVRIGEEELERLDACRNKPYKPSKIELVGIIQLYREKLKKDFL